MSKILITGATGFIGAAVGRHLNASRPADVIVMSSREDTDLLLLDEVERLMQCVAPSMVIHLAGLWGGRSFAKVWNADTMWANSLMLLNVLGAAAQNGASRFVMMMPSLVYSPMIAGPASENHFDIGGFPGNYGGFANFARYAIQVCKTFEWQYGVRSTILVAPDVYGAGGNFKPNESSWLHSLISEMVHARAKGESALSLAGAETMLVPQINVVDVARAISFAIDSDVRLMNIASGTRLTMGRAVQLIGKYLSHDLKVKWMADSAADSSDIPVDLDISLMKAVGFKPEVEPEVGLPQAIDFYLGNTA
jgi:GDP-L-fucose synthase